LDLGLINLAKGETLYPATGLNTSPSGGIIPFNNIGGPQGGIELAYWRNNFPKGLYEFIINGVSGVPVNYKIDVFENGTRDALFPPLSGFTPRRSNPHRHHQIRPSRLRHRRNRRRLAHPSFSANTANKHVHSIPIGRKHRYSPTPLTKPNPPL